MHKRLLILLFTSVFVTAVAAQPLPSLIPYLDGNKWGYADTNGHIVIAPQWQAVCFFKNGKARVYTENKLCIIDTHGTYIIPPYRNWNGEFYTSVLGAYYNARGKNGKYGIIDSNDHEMLPCLYDKTDPGNGFTSSGQFKWDKLQHKYAAKLCKNGKFGIVDTMSNILIPFAYDGIDAIESYPFYSPKYYTIKQKENFGLIDAHNHVIIQPKYRNVLLDDYNDNQIILYKERTSVIADTNGNITWEIPGYTLGFPRDSLIPVRDSAGKNGLMNYDHKLIIPCEYLGVGVSHDTIIVSQWLTDSSKKQTQCFKYYNTHTYQAISDWVCPYARRPAPVAKPPLVLNEKFPHFPLMRIHGKDVYEYKIGNILWSPSIDSQKVPEYLIPVRGIAMQNDTISYTAILDSNGNYAVPPQLTNKEWRVINESEGLIAIHSVDKSSFYSVVDFHLKTILAPQQFPIVGAFYYNDTFYAVTKHEKIYEGYCSPDFVGDHSSRLVREYTFFLVTADGKPVKAMEHYKLRWFTTGDGYPIPGGKYTYYYGQYGFDAPFKGCFMAEDSLGKKGIITIYGQILLPDLSFKYNEFVRKGPDLFIVNNFVKQNNHYVEELSPNTSDSTEHEKKLQRGLPYLVDVHNNVLLDSLTIDTISEVVEPGTAPLYNVILKYSPYLGRVSFYMNKNGKCYYGNLPGNNNK